ncbi:MAG: NAD(P)/FAD-dependent oxidoreductase, partial [Pseudomonadota bacterium]
VIIAAGLGAFEPRLLRAKGLAETPPQNVHYKVTDREQFAGRHLVILGGGDSALDWTLDLAELAASIQLVHRRHDYRAQPASVAKMKALAASGRVTETQGIVTEAECSEHEQATRLDALHLLDLARNTPRIAGDDFLVFWGLAPNLGPIADWSLALERKSLLVDTEKFQTSVPGVFAVGDINTYPGKKKLILSGFHEAALAAFAAQKHLDPEARQFLQYTTTSPIVRQRLGVEAP